MKKASLFLIICLTAQLGFSQWTTSGNNIYNSNSGYVGIGVNPSYALDVNGFMHGRNTMIVDMITTGIAGWFRGPSAGSSNVVLQSNGGGGVAWWLTGADLFKIGSGGVEPSVGTVNVTSDGKVGINTTSPSRMFDMATTGLNDGLRIGYNNSSGSVYLNPNNLTATAYNPMSQAGDAGIFFGTVGTVAPNFGFLIAPWSPNASGIRMTGTGNVLIGKATQSNSSYVLDVNGATRANQVVVNTTGADFVFDPGYRLPSLSALAKYIQTNHHLPDIAPAAQMQTQGVDLGENQTRLLQKIEELTLYVIEQNKQIESLKRENQRLEKRNSTLQSMEQRIERLEQSERK